jgi:hypothetical protein
MINFNYKYSRVLFVLFIVLIFNPILACEQNLKFGSIFLVGSTPGGAEIKSK